MKNTVGTLQPLNVSVISPIDVYKNNFPKSREIAIRDSGRRSEVRGQKTDIGGRATEGNLVADL